MPWLSLSILFPIAALGIPLLPDKGDGKVVRMIWTINHVDHVSNYRCENLNGYDPSVSGLQMSERISWLPPQLGLTWSVGADGLSMPLILLTSFITSEQQLLQNSLDSNQNCFTSSSY